ncbi:MULTISPECIES: DNA cytosine methyltransferase [Terrabacteria group]|uniref:DNA cytosine methyltransferase n=1 Tax=Bacillati TaxID=1783272 RepID=UPI001C6E6463|nr:MULTISPECIES: DNA (cytosine-5-)-methyltransferase [Terrabacteria group]MBW9213138.1 DNA cytosine methyltransferase [Trueperella sp. zg.1013]
MTYGVVDLFCGVGGLTCGLEKAGLNVVAGYDLDATCEYAYNHNNNAKFINNDIKDVSGKEIKKILQGYDIKILAGCAPCQPFSRHQKDKYNRKKHKDWKLLYQFARLVEEVKPQIVSMENVPELVKEQVFMDFISILEEQNYNITYKIVNAVDYGIPQRRKRLLLLASSEKQIKLIEPTHKKAVTVREVIAGLSQVGAGEPNNTDKLHIASSLSKKNLERIRHSIPGGTWKNWPEELILNCHRKKSGQSYSSVYGRMSWDDVAPTITTQFIGYGTGRFGHPEQDRALTLREGAMLQTFPVDYSFVPEGEKIVLKNIARHIGNAVPPRLGEIVGLSIIEHYAK